MAWVGAYSHPKTGDVTWRIQFQRRQPEGREVFSASFLTEEEARAFCDKWEELFFAGGKAAVKIDRLYERRRRKFHDRSKNIS